MSSCSGEHATVRPESRQSVVCHLTSLLQKRVRAILLCTPDILLNASVTQMEIEFERQSWLDTPLRWYRRAETCRRNNDTTLHVELN